MPAVHRDRRADRGHLRSSGPRPRRHTRVGEQGTTAVTGARGWMSRSLVFVLAAVVAHVLGWILPVIDDYRGVHAFRVALSPLWPYEDFHIPAGRLVYL